MTDLRGLVLETRDVRTQEIEIHEASPELKRVLFVLPTKFELRQFFVMCDGVGVPAERHQALLEEAQARGLVREAPDDSE
ncbi:MAG: hypothetical protein J0M16_00480 [Gammaproteobacteria bacterium]|nr:hypothetical protein [Gammaproteobacteria bacterium]